MPPLPIVVFALSLMTAVPGGGSARLAAGPVCGTLAPPVPGHVVAPFAPVGRFDGHWGVDLAVTRGEQVVAPVSGRVTFAGSVAGRLSVTVSSEGTRVSVSYLAGIEVAVGEGVTAGVVLGRAGRAHGRPAVHLSLRIDGRYVDPGPALAPCPLDLSRALWLLPPPDLRTYPARRAPRSLGRHLRPSSHRPPPRRGGRPPPTRRRRRDVRAGG